MKKPSFRLVDASYPQQSDAAAIAREIQVVAGALQRLQRPLAAPPFNTSNELNLHFVIMTKAYVEFFACYCASLKHELGKTE
ncbi:hypothetical protein [Phreatobacter cathodiphilus]|uniref:Uncharacterized protein n=1 Tax=Phreatobacter cathodiphilus TaxID=1868589 RepID=A0A2S0N7F5_9HYPH|nr:hypothetical protein [Phreatobacter cathodiphilus]AVO43873.1 hypothetical protein C6569_01635 [Phreatobacter cathodiphilus]